MKILGIHHFFPPRAVVASRRLWLLYKALEEQGASVHIISAQVAASSPIDASYANNWPIEYVASQGLREAVSPSGADSLPNAWKNRAWLRWLIPLKHSFPLLYLTDEGGRHYRQAAYKTGLQLLQSKDFTHLLSSYRPWADHLVAAQLKKAHPQLHWIADFRDLPVDPIRKDVYWPTWQTYWAKRCLRLADEVWAVSAGQADRLRNLHPKVRIVYNGLQQLPHPSHGSSDAFVIQYTGSLYPELQSIAPLAKALLRLEKQLKADHPYDPPALRLQYTGKDSDTFQQWIQKFGLQQLASSQNSLPQHAAQTQQKEATLNLLLSWSAPNYYGILTAKLYDYLAAGRPILALVNGPTDPELQHLFEAAQAGFLHHQQQSEEELYQWLASLYQTWLANGKALPWAMQPEALRPYHYQALRLTPSAY